MFKTIFKNIKEYYYACIISPFLMVLEVICELTIPFLMGKIIDNGIYQNNINEVIKYGIFMILCALSSLAFGYLSAHYRSLASTGLAKNLRKQMFENIQNFSFKNIDNFSTSSLITRLTTDVTSMQNAFQMILGICVRAPIMLCLAIFMSFSISSKLSMIFIYAIIFLSIGLSVMIYFGFKFFNKVFPKYDALNQSVQENISNIRVVKAYVKEDTETNKFKQAAYELYKLFIKAENVIAFNSPLMLLTIYSCTIALTFFGAHMINDGSLTTGGLMSLLTYIMNIMISLMMISFAFVMITMSMSSIKRISEVLNEKSSITNPTNPDYIVEDGSIEFKNVNFKYNEKSDYILNNINIEIKNGETIGILGGTGSSKSSFVNLIPRLYDVSSGEVLVGNKNVKSYDLKTLRENIAVVLQKNVLFSGTIKENLKWGNENASDEQLIQACKLAQAHNFILEFEKGYDTYIEQGGTNVSGGQKQRLCIARALLKNPKILILDDSTSAVDTKTDYLIKKAFKEDLPNMTKIIISQRISSIENSDRIIVLDDGNIVGIGTHLQLLESNEIYKEVYNTQSKGGENNE